MESTNCFVERGAGRNKRKWTDIEDAKLIKVLLELVNGGNFKADNGFKLGYLTFLETSLHDKLPEAGLKGKPYIESRIKTLKKDFNDVHDIRYGSSSSGFGWDSENHVVTALRDVWNAYIKVHPKVTKWQNTSMPWFKELSTIFRKDRATGNLAENLADIVEELNTEVNGPGAEELPLHDDVQPSTHSDESISKNKCKKHKGNIESLMEAVYAVSDRLANQFEASTKLQIAAEESIMEKKKQLNEELSKIPEIIVVQKFQASKKLAHDENLMILFFAAPDEEKTAFVEAILRCDI